MTDEEVWVRAYCEAVNSVDAARLADIAVDAYRERFHEESSLSVEWQCSTCRHEHVEHCDHPCGCCYADGSNEARNWEPKKPGFDGVEDL